MGRQPTDAAQWQQAWTDGGRRAVHIGDVADFNAQFVPQSPAARRQAHHYSCLAAFYTPDPAALLLPGEPDAEWTAWLVRELAWGPVELHTGLADEHGTVRGTLAVRPALREGIERLGLPVRPWGRTAGPGLEAVHHYESKAASHELFTRTAAGHPGIQVPRQRPARSARQAARMLAALARRGETAVLKAHHGVGGYGTAVVTPQETAAAGGARALLRGLTAGGVLPAGGRLLVEEYVPGRGRLRNLTFDAVIAGDGTVHPVGTAVMHVDGTSYRGATAGPGAVPPRAAATAEAFGLAVGAELARAGHRGWYDVDFVTDPAGRLAPTETNLRLTGPAVAFVLAARLDAVHGPGHRVRTLDRLPLGARLPQQALFAHLARLAERCERFGVRLLPTIPTASWEELPTVGVALAARAEDTVTALDALDAAEAVVRAAGEALADPFDALAPDTLAPDAPGVSARPPRGRAAR
ncbi:hypothetical protein [Streptomyces sp. NRRL B-24484]|uniref:hypothetical protein n=1 Tax=Streptomyces sp. NRRL B-24484 TaxID=1463833 RepID=UPI000AE4B90F|nr:hypothetical protein [Streptomyces sp. NRRL B-24484]